MDSFPWVGSSENPQRARVYGTVRSSAQASGGPREEAGHKLLAGLSSFFREQKKIHSCLQILTKQPLCDMY